MATVAALAGAAVALTVITVTRPPAEVEAFGLNEIARNGNVQGVLYPGDPTTEAALVKREDERVVYIRRVASAAYWTLSVDGPYRFRTGDNYTIVLPAADEPYTIDDLVALAPQTLVSNPDGSYLMGENVAVMQGATLSLAGVDLRLESNRLGFASIIAFGGKLDVSGTADRPASITSWDSSLGTEDTDTSDGRAYVRAIGGSVDISHAEISALGFWGGSTGGISITGNDAADDAALATSMDAGDDALPVLSGGAPLVDASTVFDDPEEGAAISDSDTSDTADEQPARVALPDLGISTATITDAEIDGNAFGIFVSSAEDVTIERTSVTGSLVDGITFHRAVSGSTLTDSRSTGNAVDGITLGRSTTGVTMREITSSQNGRNGISVDGQSLADGPSASGTAVEAFGDNAITASTVARNGRYGIEISGGGGIELIDNLFLANPDGLVVGRSADDVIVSGNRFWEQTATSVAIRDTVTDATVEDNIIRGGDTGIRVRNAGAQVHGNELSDISNHAVTLVGDVGGTTVDDNELGGSGPTALRSEGSDGAVIGENDVDGWRPALTPEAVLGYVFQPLTVVWVLLALLLLGTALTRKDRQYGKIRDPYAERVPLTSLSRGIVAIDDAHGVKS
jgi:hypothetical protein